ncbi:CGNR zinc finger domain-containing protein [Paraburkholderia sp. J67]|uniref:CGNR zinc finger domain-containing protein n=1 Tax=Paraburkholderia sp. J67 TaxID=2805435 RepID=UPI002ABE17A8|nr:ABATE domain-containing protein [Paraburkholderia sp. J67]
MDDQEWNAGSFAGGALCLDFANTQGGWDKTRDHERLPDYSAAIEWACAAGAVSESESLRLRAMAQRVPTEAECNAKKLRFFRECLYRLFSALAAGHEAKSEDEDCLRAAIAAALDTARLKSYPGGYDWKIDQEKAGLNTMLNRIALDAQKLILGSETPNVKECERCSWLFVDRSKNKRRRWCKAETCGNRTRASKHYQLTKA